MNRLHPRSRSFAIVLAFSSLGVGLSGSLQPALPDAPLPLVLEPGRVLAQARAGGFDFIVDATPYHFELQPHPMALGALIGLDGVPVGRVTETVTFSGTANGLPALVAATHAGVWIAILGPDPLIVEPLWLTQPDAARDQHRVLWWSENPPVIPPHPDPAPPGTASNPALDAGEVLIPRNRTARFLIESDFAFYQRFSLVGTCDLCWVEAQQAVLLIAEFNFRRDAHIRFNITSQWACTTAQACPYSTDPAHNDMGVWLGTFIDRWEAIPDETPHDLAHLLISTDLPVFVGAAGEPSGWAISEFATPPTQDNLLHYVVATHEIGHNLNASHSQAAPVPPLLNPLPPQADGKAWTVMKPGEKLRFQFSDGTYSPSLNNLDRILAYAAQTLPA